MADALLSPATGITMWAASAAALAFSARQVRSGHDDRLVPVMGVLGAFVFAAQMINFAIPGTGSSGHLGGGLLLAALLGPYAALTVIASVLTVQALFFADGGLLALGANIFNVGVLPCLIAYPLVFRPLVSGGHSPSRVGFAAVAAAVVALQLGALGVVLQTTASGISELSFATFALLMFPIHLAIGLGEGLATAALLLFLAKARPDLFHVGARPRPRSLAPLSAGFALVVLITAMALPWFASTRPDGLEWAIAHAAQRETLAQPQTSLHRAAGGLRQSIAVFPEYQWTSQPPAAEAEAPWPAVSLDVSAAGLVGSTLTLLAVWLSAVCIRRLKR